MNIEDEREARSSYHSPVREEQAKLTRRRIANAARALFLENGYAGTTLRQVAEKADVSDQTIYAIYKNKRGLLIAIAESMEVQVGAEEASRDLAAAEGNATRQLSVFVAFDCRLFEREGPTLRILRDAGSAEPEMRQAYLAGRNRGRDHHLHFMRKWEADGVLRDTVNAERAADLYHAISSIDTFSYLVDERGWSPEEWEQHTFRLLAGAMLRSEEGRS